MFRGGVDRPGDGSDAEFVEFFSAGASVKGQFQCSACGYGVTIYAQLPACPMCAGAQWEQIAWSPFARAGASRGG